jgi:hypothetical protein
MASISGKLAGGRLGSNLISGTYRYEFEESADELDGTTGSDLGYAHPDSGVLGATVRLSCYFELGATSYTPLRAGTAVTVLKLYDDLSDSEVVNIPNGIIFGSVKQSEVRGRMEVSCTIKSVGSYTVNA